MASMEEWKLFTWKIKIIYLKENSFSVFAFWTGVILWSGQGRVSNDVSNNLGQLVHLVHDLVDVDAAAVR